MVGNTYGVLSPSTGAGDIIAMLSWPVPEILVPGPNSSESSPGEVTGELIVKAKISQKTFVVAPQVCLFGIRGLMEIQVISLFRYRLPKTVLPYLAIHLVTTIMKSKAIIRFWSYTCDLLQFRIRFCRNTCWPWPASRGSSILSERGTFQN